MRSMWIEEAQIAVIRLLALQRAWLAELLSLAKQGPRTAWQEGAGRTLCMTPIGPGTATRMPARQATLGYRNDLVFLLSHHF